MLSHGAEPQPCERLRRYDANQRTAAGRDGRYARRRIIASDDVQRRENLTNISFWPFMPPFRDAAHRSAVLSLAYLALSMPAVGRRLVSEHLRERNSTPRAAVVWLQPLLDSRAPAMRSPAPRSRQQLFA